MLHDSCVDKPTPDQFECSDQARFGKCFDPFMISPLGAQWPGGFCQRTCERCTCNPADGASCAEVWTPPLSPSVLHFRFGIFSEFCGGSGKGTMFFVIGIGPTKSNSLHLIMEDENQQLYRIIVTKSHVHYRFLQQGP